MIESLKSVTTNPAMADQIPPLQLYTLGPPEVRLGDHLVSFATRKTQALLFYLAIETGMQPREQLATLLWPEANAERSYANLRNTLGHLQSALRRAYGQSQPPHLQITHNALGLNPDAVIHIDVQTVQEAYAQARADRASRLLPEGSASLPAYHSAAACQRGDFLAGFSLRDAPGFDEWVTIQREIWRRRLGLVLDRMAEIQFASGDFAGAAESAARWIASDALNEVAYRSKMRAHFAAGERGQALETYELCRSVLAAELGIQPEPDTAALADRIRQQAPPAFPKAHLTTPQPPRLETSAAFLGSLFVGRDREVQTLVEHYERAALGQPQLVVLRGEAGIGKTRLARKFLDWASQNGAELLQGGAFESGIHLPFQPLVDAIRLRLVQEFSPLDLLEDAWIPSLSRLLPELRQHLSNSLPAPKEPAHHEMEARQAEVFEPLTQFMISLAGRAPLVVFLDDLQWVDAATLDLLHYAIRRWNESAARVMVLISLRLEALQPMNQPRQTGGPRGLVEWLDSMDRELTPLHLELGSLGEHETVNMVLSLLTPPAADFAQWMYDETRGQPFYLLETLKDFLERRVLQPKPRRDGQWTFVLDAEHDLGRAVRVPSTVQAVIRSRLNRLSPNAFSLLASGAVLDQGLSFDSLRTIANVSEDLALVALDELISVRMLMVAAQPGAASAYTFANDMLRDVVYTEAGDARRQLYHRRALEMLEASRAPAAVLAHHALAAGLAQAAFRHSLSAGREALRIAALGEASVHFERARQIVEDAPGISDEGDLGELFVQLRRTYELGGQKEKALALQASRSVERD